MEDNINTPTREIRQKKIWGTISKERNISGEELLKRFNAIRYEAEDIDVINACIKIIDEIMSQYDKKFN